MTRLIALVLVALALPAQAAAAPRLDMRAVGTTDGPVMGDGVRFTAWQRGTTVTVMDDRAPTRSLAVTPTCQPTPPQARALGSGHLLVQTCVPTQADQRTELEVHDLRTGARTTVAPPSGVDPTTYGGGFPATFVGVGKQWIEVGAGGNHWTARLFHNWRTGRVVDDTGDRRGPRALPDQDRGGLYRPLCRPLARPENPFGRSGTETFPAYLDIRYRSRRAIMFAGRRNGPARLELWRCGRARPTILTRCAQTCGTFDLTADHAIWLEGDGVRVRNLRSGRTYIARPPSGPIVGKPAVSGGRLLVVAGETVYAARLPRR